MANDLNISIPTLFRKFSQYFAVSPSNYINDIRLQKASFMLEKTDLKIKEIAARIGFDDEFYFSKLFKKNMDIPCFIQETSSALNFPLPCRQDHRDLKKGVKPDTG